MKRRRRFENEISTKGLGRIALLIRLAEKAELPTPTKALLAAARLERDPHSGRGALKMAESLGRIHAVRGQRKTLLWKRVPDRRERLAIRACPTCFRSGAHETSFSTSLGA